jgi:hypothetical protein
VACERYSINYKNPTDASTSATGYGKPELGPIIRQFRRGSPKLPTPRLKGRLPPLPSRSYLGVISTHDFTHDPIKLR